MTQNHNLHYTNVDFFFSQFTLNMSTVKILAQSHVPFLHAQSNMCTFRSPNPHNSLWESLSVCIMVWKILSYARFSNASQETWRNRNGFERRKKAQYTMCLRYVNLIRWVICNFVLSLNFKLHQITNLQLKTGSYGFKSGLSETDEKWYWVRLCTKVPKSDLYNCID